MSVHNIGFLLDRLGQDCHPLQYLRELTQNSIEAVQRTGEAGQIVWDVDWTTHDFEAGVYKLSVTDNGAGIGAEKARVLFENGVVSNERNGLGLHLVRDLAKAIGIKVTVESEEGKGIKFRLIVGKGNEVG
jgi:sensor histidine kinase regulating citrate/malate metabolism